MEDLPDHLKVNTKYFINETYAIYKCKLFMIL
jgi:hypothetical protein